MEVQNPTLAVPKSTATKRPLLGGGPKKAKTKKRRVRTKQDFLNFCIAVLKYADYQPDDDDDDDEDKFDETDFNMNLASPTNDSLGSNSDSNSNDTQPDEKLLTKDIMMPPNMHSSEDEDHITCFCNKPFGGRPMIQCGSCMTWIHLSCAKIRRNHIPEVFICTKCRDASQTSRKSTRVRTENKKFATDL